MKSVQDNKIKLQGHEKFALRDGWLNKGIITVAERPDAFQGKEGPDLFGIGNNMVKSLRYWLKAFGLVEEKAGKGALLTPLGKLIMENDPYFEDVFTIWILHCFIAKNIHEATSWYMFFNRMNDIEDFEKEQIEKILYREIAKYAIGQTFSENSVKNDLDVLLSMYGKTKAKVDPEDKSVSPFAQLGLVNYSYGKYSKSHPDGRIISEWNALYELTFLMADTDSISIDDAVNGEMGLSRIYQITLMTANDLLDKLDALGFIRVNRTAGLDVIYKNNELTPEAIVKAYYQSRQ